MITLTGVGPPTPPTSPLFLNTYPNAALAYSVFKLNSTYAGKCLRVRRSSDNTETDIGFISNYIDTSALLSFTGVYSGFIVKWYDQSGNGNDLVQTTAVTQPQIVNAGTLIVINGKAAMNFDGVNDYFDLSNPIPINNVFSSLNVCSIKDGEDSMSLSNSTSPVGYSPYHYYDNVIYSFGYSKSIYSYAISAPTTTQVLISNTQANNGLFKNNVNIFSGTGTAIFGGNFNSFGLRNLAEFKKGMQQEYIHYQTDQSPNISAMNLNRMNAFGL